MTHDQIEVDEITLPAAWASALVNGDFSGLELSYPDEAKRCQLVIDALACRNESIVSTVDDSQRFTWHYDLYDKGAGVSSGTVMDYVIHRV
jgi:hypothetical protein